MKAKEKRWIKSYLTKAAIINGITAAMGAGYSKPYDIALAIEVSLANANLSIMAQPGVIDRATDDYLEREELAIQRYQLAERGIFIKPGYNSDMGAHYKAVTKGNPDDAIYRAHRVKEVIKMVFSKEVIHG